MPRLFVFGIGGTGARVIKSLTMLLASGVRTSGYDIVPILIDPHKDLGELKNCKKMLERYVYINKALYENYSTKIDGGYFQSKIVSLGSIGSEELKEDFDFDSRIDESFQEFLKMNHLENTDPNKDLLNLLYSDVGLNKRLSVGFKGNPNIGSVVLNQFEHASWYKTFGKVFSPGDKIFLIGSIFGGTGASGFPLLLQNLRRHDNKNIKDAEIGALPVMPYFKLGDPDENNANNDIDSNNFFTKTKAALSYYYKNVKGINAFYYLSDPDASNVPYENDEENQPNKAHIVEMIGASSILHFCGNSSEGESEHYSFGLETNDNSITFKTIGDPLKDTIISKLTNFLLFNLTFDSIKNDDTIPFRKTSKFDSRFFKSDFVVKLQDFNNKYFMPWIRELDQNDRAFSPFNLKADEHFHSLVKTLEISKSKFIFLKSRFETANVINEMNQVERKFNEIDESHKFSKYLEMSNLGIKNLIRKKLNIS